MPNGILEELVELVGITPQESFPDIDEGTMNVEISVDEMLELPAKKPDIEQLVNVHINVEITRTKIIPTPIGYKAVVRGVVKQKIVYVADVPEQSLHAAHFARPFCAFIPLPKEDKDDEWEKDEKPDSRESCSPHARAIVEDVQIVEYGKRHILKSVLLFIWLE